MINSNIQDWFLSSYIPSSHKVLGKTLQPLSLHHLIYLYAIESPYLVDPRSAKISDTVAAVLICSTRLPDGELDRLESVLNPCKYSPERSMGLTRYPFLSPIPKWKKRMMKLGKQSKVFNEVEKIKFTEYLNRSLSSAPIHKDERSSKKVPLPWIQNYFQIVANAYKWPRNSILNLPYSELITHILAIQYSLYGEYNVITEEDKIAIDFVKSLPKIDESLIPKANLFRPNIIRS